MKVELKNIIYYTLIMAAMLVAASCGEDDMTDPYDTNYVFLYSPPSVAHNLVYRGDGVFTQEIKEQEMLVPVRCTRPAPADITVTVSLDKSLVDAYNAQQGTNYVFLENARLEKSTFIIKKGEYMSPDSLRVTYTDKSEFQNGSMNYILPVAVSAVEGKGVVLSKENHVFYLTYESTLLQIEITDSPVGTMVSNTGEWSYKLDGSPTNFDEGFIAIYDGSVFELNMGQPVSVQTIGIHFPLFYYSPAASEVYASDDGISYEKIGNVNFNPTAGDHYIHFFAARQMKYVKLVLKGTLGIYPGMMMAITIYQPKE